MSLKQPNQPQTTNQSYCLSIEKQIAKMHI